MITRPFRVAFWHNTFAPYRVPLFQQLAAFDDLDLTVYYGSEKDAHRAWPVNFGEGYRHVQLPYLSIPGYPHKLNYTLFGELLRQRYDVQIASENELGCQIAYLAARWTHCPFILWSEQIDYEIIRDQREYTVAGCFKKIVPFLGRELQQILFFPLYYGADYVKRHADACLAAGRKTEDHLMRVGSKGPFFRHGSTIDTVQFQRRLQAWDIATVKRALRLEGKIVILSVGYLQKRKGVQYLLDAYLQLPHPDTVLVIVGDGDYKAELLRLVPEHRRDILFVGHDEDTTKYYAVADIFAMPSFSDPWGLTINEAMLAGLPVITTTNVGAQELIQGNGFVIPPRNALALRQALTTLLQDRELRATMGRRSLEIIQAYTIEHTALMCRAAIYAVTQQRSEKTTA